MIFARVYLLFGWALLLAGHHWNPSSLEGLGRSDNSGRFLISDDISEAEGNEASQILIATYNAHLLPPVASPFAGRRSNSNYRAGAVAEHLYQFDIIGFCEVFSADGSKKLVESFSTNRDVGYQVVRGPGRGKLRGTGSGLLLLSRFPVVQQHELVFQASSRMWRDGRKADGLATKGVLHVVINYQGVLVDLFLTHLDSLSESVRKKQIEELANFILIHSDLDRPAILMGDLNIVGPKHGISSEEEYDAMVLELSQTTRRRLIDLGSQLTAGTSNPIDPGNADRIDYIFALPSVGDATSLKGRVGLAHLLDAKVEEGSLSDHSAVVSKIRLPLNSR